MNAHWYALDITMPSAVSKRLMPAANNTGRARMPRMEYADCAAEAERASRPISVAVSKPRPNRKPRG
ncbi:hypothetical protein D3C81_1927960 [compost metagenome]